jgi:hypothetical protein
VDVRREAGDDDAALAAGERLAQVGPDDGLRQRPARAVRVGRVTAQQQDPVTPKLRQARHVGGNAVDRGLVELVVAGHQRGAQLARQRVGEHVGDRVGHLHGLDVEGAGVDVLPRAHLLQRHVLELVLVELGAHHRDRERPAVDRRPVVELAQHERQRADVVLVAVG